MNKNNVQSAFHRAKTTARNLVGKASAAGTALMASGAAFAGGSSPGSAIAGELSGGKADVMLVVGAAAIILGALIVWGYVKKAR